ncbi:uncharacterized protein LOC141837110 [Curcuma longa]|uniref:uncharacterized protein LOC141837110 n=1 Tax=Curcuma longa TaxID=136217 RepID=UPI003D9E425C
MAGGRRTEVSYDEGVDHYAVLCLPSGEEGAKLTLKQIEKAYHSQSRIRHPDKRPDDPNATADFQRLKTSFEVLKDEAARRVFDARLRARRERVLRDSALDAKRRKLATDLEERERAAEAEDEADSAKQSERREKDVAARLQEELAEFQARKAKKPTFASDPTSKVVATRSVCGSLSNPLFVLPVQAPAPNTPSPLSVKASEPMNPIHENTIAAGFQDYEASILKKLQKNVDFSLDMIKHSPKSGTSQDNGAAAALKEGALNSDCREM